MTKFAHPFNFMSCRKDLIWYGHALLVIPDMAFFTLCPTEAIAVWHMAYTVQFNFGRAFHTSLSLSGFTRKRRKSKIRKAISQIMTNLSAIKDHSSWIKSQGQWQLIALHSQRDWPALQHSSLGQRVEAELNYIQAITEGYLR